MRKLIAVTMVLGAVGAILLTQHLNRRVACETCHQGWKMQIDDQTVLPPLQTVIQKTDENLVIDGKRIVARRLDPDSERFRDALMKDAK